MIFLSILILLSISFSVKAKPVGEEDLEPFDPVDDYEDEEQNLSEYNKFTFKGDKNEDQVLKIHLYYKLQSRTALSDPKSLWDNGIIPYKLSGNFSDEEKAGIEEAADEFRKKTCIDFRPHKNEDQFLVIEPGSGCSAHVGQIEGYINNTVKLAEGCFQLGTILHEFMHVLGFVHEHNRPDRDEYIKVVEENIMEDFKSQFEKYSWDEALTLNFTYDYGSIMHYGPNVFAKDKDNATIIPLKEGVKIGQRDGFSEIDLLKINKLYKCPGNDSVSCRQIDDDPSDFDEPIISGRHLGNLGKKLKNILNPIVRWWNQVVIKKEEFLENFLPIPQISIIVGEPKILKPTPRHEEKTAVGSTIALPTPEKQMFNPEISTMTNAPTHGLTPAIQSLLSTIKEPTITMGVPITSIKDQSIPLSLPIFESGTKPPSKEKNEMVPTKEFNIEILTPGNFKIIHIMESDERITTPRIYESTPTTGILVSNPTFARDAILSAVTLNPLVVTTAKTLASQTAKEEKKIAETTLRETALAKDSITEATTTPLTMKLDNNGIYTLETTLFPKINLPSTKLLKEHFSEEIVTTSDGIENSLLLDIGAHSIDYHRIRIIQNVKSRTAVRNPKRLWPAGVIPFTLSDQYDEFQKGMILNSMEEFHKKTCIKYINRTDEVIYVFMEPSDRCAATIGLHVSGENGVKLAEGCYQLGTIIHELMHVLGFIHEQNRPDRDEFVKIVWDNIEPRFKHNFKKYNWSQVQSFGQSYDYGSIMHYDAFEFAIDENKPTIIPLKEGVKIGQRDSFSKIDLIKINKLYNCKNMEFDSTKMNSPPAAVEEFKKYVLTLMQNVFENIQQNIKKFTPSLL